MLTKQQAQEMLESRVRCDFQIKLLERKKQKIENVDQERQRMVRIGVKVRIRKLEMAAIRLETRRKIEMSAYLDRLNASREVARRRKDLLIYQRNLNPKRGIYYAINMAISARKRQLAKMVAGAALKEFVDQQALALYQTVKSNSKTERIKNETTQVDTEPKRNIFGRRDDAVRPKADDDR